MNYPHGQPTQNFSQDPSMPPGYPEESRGFQQMQDMPQRFSGMQETPQCQEPKKRQGLFGLNFGPFGGGKRKKRTKRKRSKRRKSRRS